MEASCGKAQVDDRAHLEVLPKRINGDTEICMSCCQKYSWQIHVDKEKKNTWANRTSFQNQYNIRMLEDDPNICLEKER